MTKQKQNYKHLCSLFDRGLLDPTLRALKTKNAKGYTVAHYMASEGHTFTDSAIYLLRANDGTRVVSLMAARGNIPIDPAVVGLGLAALYLHVSKYSDYELHAAILYVYGCMGRGEDCTDSGLLHNGLQCFARDFIIYTPKDIISGLEYLLSTDEDLVLSMASLKIWTVHGCRTIWHIAADAKLPVWQHDEVTHDMCAVGHFDDPLWARYDLQTWFLDTARSLTEAVKDKGPIAIPMLDRLEDQFAADYSIGDEDQIPLSKIDQQIYDGICKWSPEVCGMQHNGFYVLEGIIDLMHVVPKRFIDPEIVLVHNVTTDDITVGDVLQKYLGIAVIDGRFTIPNNVYY